MSLPKKRKPLTEQMSDAVVADLKKFAQKEKTMSATNSKTSNKIELKKLGKTQTRDKKVSQKTGKPKKTGYKGPVGASRDLPTTKKQTIAPDANVTIKPRAVKIKPAA